MEVQYEKAHLWKWNIKNNCEKLVSKICKEFSQLNNKKKNSSIKNGQKI